MALEKIKMINIYAYLNFYKPKLKEGFDRFFRENGHYPTAIEIDNCDYLPNTRKMQRVYGGIVNVREELELDIIDYTKGDIRRETAINIQKKALEEEKKIWNFLVEKFGETNVHREYQPFDDRRCRADFKIFSKGKQFIVDVFNPKDKASLSGCLNLKMRKYDASFGDDIFPFPVIFLQMNKNLSSELVKKLVENKKNKLHKNQSVMCIDEFKDFCNNQ